MRTHTLSGNTNLQPHGPTCTRALPLELQAPRHDPTRALGLSSHTFSSTPASAAQSIEALPSPNFGLTFTLAQHCSGAPFSARFISLSSFLPHATQALLTMVSYHPRLQTLTPAELADDLCPARDTPLPTYRLTGQTLPPGVQAATPHPPRLWQRNPTHMTTAAFPRYDNKCMTST